MLIGRPQPIDGRPRSKTIGEGRLEHRQNRTMRCASLDVNRDHVVHFGRSARLSLKMTCIKRISTKNIFQKFEFLDQKFHASEQNENSRQQTNDFSRANERSGTHRDTHIQT